MTNTEFTQEIENLITELVEDQNFHKNELWLQSVEEANDYVAFMMMLDTEMEAERAVEAQREWEPTIREIEAAPVQLSFLQQIVAMVF